MIILIREVSTKVYFTCLENIDFKVKLNIVANPFGSSDISIKITPSQVMLSDLKFKKEISEQLSNATCII